MVKDLWLGSRGGGMHSLQRSLDCTLVSIHHYLFHHLAAQYSTVLSHS